MWHSQRQIVTRSVEGPIVRATYAEVFDRAKRLSECVEGPRASCRATGSLRWHGTAAGHVEAWYAAMGIGRGVPHA